MTNEAKAAHRPDGETKVIDLMQALKESLNTTPKDIPVLLKGPLVRAFLADRKTVTRRTDLDKWRKAKPGDRIWFKETWHTSKCCDDKKPSDLEIPGGGYGWPVWYAADGGEVTWRGAKTGGPGFVAPGRTRVSIHMPKWAARCWAVIEDIREERLQDITERDAIAEGVSCWVCDGPVDSSSENDCGCFHSRQMARESFAVVWDSINGNSPGISWADNPTVARIQFRRIEVPR